MTLSDPGAASPAATFERRSDRDVFAYEPRRLLSDPVVTWAGWRIKPYRMAYPGGETQLARLDGAALLKPLLAPADDPAFHGLGFSIVHVARDGVYQLIGRWYAGNNLMSEAHAVRDTDGAPTYRRLSLFACVWEMSVYAHERQAWINTMMSLAQGMAGAEDYLACRMEGWV